MITEAQDLFVDAVLGEYPLIITCPHDGRAQPPDTPERPDEQAGCRIKKQADLFTRTIAVGLFGTVENLTGSAPSSVVARFHRRFIDANRPERCAFQAPEARKYHREYHRRIRKAIAAVRTQFPRRGVLVDIHGAADQADQPDIKIFIGTDNRRSISRLLALDPEILWRRAGLVRTLQAGGFGVIPAEAEDPEHPNFDGGFTVRRHGAAHASGLDALQIEIVRSVRQDADRRNALIQALTVGLTRLLARQKRLVQS